jgi:hypothetical protein
VALTLTQHMLNGALLLLFAASCANAQERQQFPNERFAHQIADIQPTQWKDFEPVLKNDLACMSDKKQATPVCKSVQERMVHALYDALSQALILNALAKSGEPKFCETYGQQLIVDRKFGQAVAYALLVVDERMKYGSSLYGASLPDTYLSKIIHDSFLEAHPCKP